MPLLEADQVTVAFRLSGRCRLLAVNAVSMRVERGETVGLVGESGCGKTTFGSALLGLVPSAAGRVLFDGRDLSTLRGPELKHFRRQAQMVFQDPYGSLNPRLTIGAAIAEALLVHGIGNRPERAARVREILETVGLRAEHAGRYPHEFSGGQRQRVGIARALVLQPAFVVADEPVSALDVSVQVQILNLMKDLQEKMGLSYLFVAHDLAVVRYLCRRIAVMYLGRIVETADAETFFRACAHPYSEALLAAVPDIDKGLEARRLGRPRVMLRGEAPSALDTISGCPFHPRCRRAQPLCRESVPALRTLGSGHAAACHFAEIVKAEREGAP